MGPLEGIKVIEIAGIGPCPITGMMLADLGAEVILVERAAENPNGAGVGGVIESAFFPVSYTHLTLPTTPYV